MLVSYENGELQRPERLLVDVVRWATAEVDISSARDRPDAVAVAAPVFKRILEQDADGRPVACRGGIHRQVARPRRPVRQERILRAELLAQAINVAGDNLWIEKIKGGKSEPITDAAAIAARGDALGDLQGMLADAAQDPAFMASLKAEFGVLLGKVDLDVYKQDVPALKAAKEGRFAELVAEVVVPSVIDRIAREE